MTVKEKRDESLKGRFCTDGRKQRGTMEKDESALPTVAMDSVFITASMEAAEHRDVAVVDLPGAYLSADMDDEEEVLMVLRGPLAELMALTAPQVYRKFVTVDANGRQILYVKLQKALYGLLKSALLFYRKLWGDLHAKGFTINPYDPCVANKDIGGLQMTVCWHVDDLKMSHKSPQVTTGIIEWLRGVYGNLRIFHG